MEQSEETTKKTKPRLKLPLLGLFLSTGGTLFAILTLNPGKRGPVAILLFLGLLYLAFLSFCATLIDSIRYLASLEEYSWQKILYSSIILATGLIFLVGLQTLGQLQPIDIILVIIFETLLNFYFFRRF